MYTFVSYATAHGMYVILDPHNFQRYWPDISNFNGMQSGSVGVVGGTVVPDSAFSNFWYQIASIYKNNPHVIFGLMNEPNAVPETQMVTSENTAIAAIRATGATNMIFVPGNRWTGAWTWSHSDGYGAANSNAMLSIVDPGNNYVFEVHQYLDSDGSGSNDGVVSADIGWQRLTNFTAWARANHVKGFLGEYRSSRQHHWRLGSRRSGADQYAQLHPTNSDVWLGWTYWGGGPWWGSNPTFPIEPSNISNPTDQPTMSIIKEFTPAPGTDAANRQQQHPIPVFGAAGFRLSGSILNRPDLERQLGEPGFSHYQCAAPGSVGPKHQRALQSESGIGPTRFLSRRGQSRAVNRNPVADFQGRLIRLHGTVKAVGTGAGAR